MSVHGEPRAARGRRGRPASAPGAGQGEALLSPRAPLSPWRLLERLNLPGRRPPEESLRDVKVSPQILHDFRPLAQSLEWMLSDLAWASEGVQHFASSSVPFIVNNNGRASENAAIVLFASCAEAGPAEGPIKVLEVGAGPGLFARYFLSGFRTLCQQEGRDFYDRLVYYVSDRSRRTIEQWVERRIFAEFGPHVVMGTCDATEPSRFRPLAGYTVGLSGLRAGIANYALDVLPSAVVRTGENGAEQLCVRTHMTRSRELLRQYTPLDFDEVRALAGPQDPEGRARLIPFLSLLEFETDFLPVRDDPPPYLSEALAFGRGLGKLTLNHGAIHCLEECFRLLRPEGFVLVNDYGPVERDQIEGLACAQRFGSTVALGINFPFLEHYFSQKGLIIAKPDGDDARQIHARLISSAPSPRTLETFREQFGSGAYAHYEGPIQETVQHIAAGRNNEALDSFRTALARNPRDWHLIGRAAEFVGLQLREFPAGLELIRSALDLNPWYSAWLWNVLGDCLFCLERFADAHDAYVQAQRIDPEDVRTNFNLSYTYFQSASYLEALVSIARGLARDVQGTYRDRLLEKQRQIVQTIAGRWIGEQERLVKRAVIFSAPGGEPGKG